VRVVVDCRYVRLGRHDGISRYTARIVEALARLHPEVVMLVHDPRQLEMLPTLPHAFASSPTSWREPWVARRVNRLEPDVVFSPMQTMGSWGRRYGLVLTLHDLIYYRHRTPPRDLPRPVRVLWRLYHLAWWPQRVLLNRADEVVTVSATTRDLIREHRLTRRDVAVVPNAADAPPAPVGPRARPGGDVQELVYMGSFMPYKNVDALVRALAELPGHRLHLMSGIPAGERARLSALAPPDSLVVHDGASDEEYLALLGRATALVHASFDEGFGIPLVEAMSLGTPVAVSDIPIFREIGGDAAEYFDPASPASIAAAVLRLADPEAWAARSAASTAQAARFSWDRSAEELLVVLRRVAARRPPERRPRAARSRRARSRRG